MDIHHVRLGSWPEITANKESHSLQIKSWSQKISWSIGRRALVPPSAHDSEDRPEQILASNMHRTINTLRRWDLPTCAFSITFERTLEKSNSNPRTRMQHLNISDCATFVSEAFAGTLLLDTLARHSSRTLLLGTFRNKAPDCHFIRHAYFKLLWDMLASDS